MKRSFAMKWADALESGKYPQTTGVLKNGDGYCCLGVACLLAGKEFDGDDSTGWHISQHMCTLPESVEAHLGMNSEVGKYPGGVLADLNDSGSSFKEIAAIIRKHWREL